MWLHWSISACHCKNYDKYSLQGCVLRILCTDSYSGTTQHHGQYVQYGLEGWPGYFGVRFSFSWNMKAKNIFMGRNTLYVLPSSAWVAVHIHFIGTELYHAVQVPLCVHELLALAVLFWRSALWNIHVLKDGLKMYRESQRLLNEAWNSRVIYGSVRTVSSEPFIRIVQSHDLKALKCFSTVDL